MDLDGSSMNSQSGDIDQNLLLQFSCMNTTDREELISQLQKLLGPNINYNTASFFLDMNNWNLQAAVCSYLDYALPARLPSMSIKTIHPPAEEIVGAGTCFERSWTVQNNGTDYWPGRCQVTNVGGGQFSCSNVYVPPLPPGNSITITLNLTAPVSSGKHEGHFRLMTERGDYFGDSFIVEITVDTETTIALVEQLAAMPVPSNQGSVQNNVNNESQAYRQIPQWDDQMC